VGVGVGVGVDAGAAAGAALVTKTPLFQIFLLPVLMHVYFFPVWVTTWPTLLQVPPAFTAATAIEGDSRESARAAANKKLLGFFI
jgi:hypothetical protein